MSKDALPETVNWIESNGMSRRQAVVAGSAVAGFALAAHPVSADVITTPAEGLDEGMISFKSGDIDMPAYRAKPAGKSDLPVVIVVQEIFGLHAWVKDVVRRFAKAGYLAIAPDYYVRQGDATTVADIKTLVDSIVSKVPDAQVMADTDAAVAHATKEGGDAKRLAVTGFCWGGRVTWLYAAHNPKLKAGVAWYGRLTDSSGSPATNLRPRNPIDLVGKMKAPVLGLYGEKDAGIPLTDVDAMIEALKAVKSKSDINVYPGADHGFFADYRPSYHEAASRDAWLQCLTWFKSNGV
jgi:carboxymethylenebutenolidase